MTGKLVSPVDPNRYEECRMAVRRQHTHYNVWDVPSAKILRQERRLLHPVVSLSTKATKLSCSSSIIGTVPHPPSLYWFI